jgi:ABC-type methionine transport system ATPase subunit
MQMMLRLNRELGTTFIVVTHDPAVARQTKRIIELDSGRIVRAHEVGSPYEEDWKELRGSALGQALLKGQMDDLSVDGKALVINGRLTADGLQLRQLLLQNGN